LKLNTITDPFKGSGDELIRYSETFRLVTSRWLMKAKVKFPDFKESSIFMITKSSPLCSKSFEGYYSDMVLMPEELFLTLRSFLEETNQDMLRRYVNYQRKISKQLHETYPELILSHLKEFAKVCFKLNGVYPFGQLSTKEEAAGKVRVFAMVDF